MKSDTARAGLWAFAAVLWCVVAFRVVLADPRSAVIIDYTPHQSGSVAGHAGPQHAQGL